MPAQAQATPAARVGPAPATGRWGVVSLLFAAIVINYIDRGNLSVAAVPLMEDLEISPALMGGLLSAFFWTYTLLQIPSGYIVDRFGIKWTYAAAFALWSLSSAVVGWSSTFLQVMGLRLLLGVGEAMAQPVSLAYIRRSFPVESQGLPTGIYLSGMMFGPAAGLYIGGHLVEALGWRDLFIYTGLGAMVWLLPWLIWAPDTRHEAPALPRPAAPLAPIDAKGLLSSRLFWGVTVGAFFFSYFWYFVLTWLPSYLVMAHGFSFKQMGAFTGLPLLFMAVVAPIGGKLADRLVDRTGRPLWSRKVFFCTGLLVASSVVVVLRVSSDELILAALLVSLGGLGLASANFWAMLQSISPAAFAGRAVGYQNTIANLSGVCAPILTGYLVGTEENFELAILFAAGALWVAAAAYLFFVNDRDVPALQALLGVKKTRSGA